MSSLKLSRKHARQLFLQAQGLGGSWPITPGPEGTAQTINRLGYVQIDTISVVERAHHHTLWTRQPDYQTDYLDELLAERRDVFEYWYPAASYLPMENYRFCLPMMRDTAQRSDRWSRWLKEHTELTQSVLKRIRQEGPLGSADFKAPEGFARGGWWSWKPAKRALEYLFAVGEIMISERRNFQRVYDLTERVLPPQTDTTIPDEASLGRFLARQALETMGVAGERNTRWRGRYRKLLANGLHDLAQTGEAVAVAVEDINSDSWYALAGTLDTASSAPEEPALHILSPFDSLVIHRDWLETLFDFFYRIECYTPREKRRYGYFSLPILWGDRFIARLDAKADRESRTLLLQQLTFEPETDPSQALLDALAEGIWRLARFNGCSTITSKIVDPPTWGMPLIQALEHLGSVIVDND